MKSMLRAVVLGMAVVGVVPGVAPAQDAEPVPQEAEARDNAQVPVAGVVLFSSGVGYFEHFGTVEGAAQTELRFKTEQINDILKSLVLEDLDGGRVANVTYPSQDPIEKTLKSFQVDITSNPNMADLLNQLRGAEVSGNLLNGQKFSGTVLGVEQKERPMGEDGEPVEVPVMNLVSGAQITSVALDEVGTLTLEDDELQAELAQALEALAQARDQDKKPVVIHFAGNGERRVRLGYVVETPVWKTSYRLIMPGGDEPAKLQGWAIVENQTDNDWNNVQLSLVSGRPISFVQDLYQPLYVPRPVVVPELYASLRPQTYGAGVGALGDEMQAQKRANVALRETLARRRAGAAGEAVMDMAASAPMPAPEAQQLGFSRESRIDPTSSVATIASAASMGELFQYTVPNVDLPRQKSAMLPIVTDEVEVERVSIYNPNVLPRNPLNGAQMKNTTDKHLLAGPITVLDEGSYAGDASIDHIPPDQSRLLSYGIDLKMQVDADKATNESRVVSGRIVKGILEVSHRHVAAREYRIENRAETARALLIEHPFHQGWKLIDTPEPVESTDKVHRFRVDIDAGKPATFAVREERVRAQSIAILPMDLGQLQVHMQTGEIPQPVKDALARAMELKRAMVTTERQIEQRQEKLNRYPNDQARIRENMRVIDRNTDLHRELHQRLQTQEQEIVRLQDEIEALGKTLDEQRAELENYLSGLNVG